MILDLEKLLRPNEHILLKTPDERTIKVLDASLLKPGSNWERHFDPQMKEADIKTTDMKIQDNVNKRSDSNYDSSMGENINEKAIHIEIKPKKDEKLDLNLVSSYVKSRFTFEGEYNIKTVEDSIILLCDSLKDSKTILKNCTKDTVIYGTDVIVVETDNTFVYVEWESEENITDLEIILIFGVPKDIEKGSKNFGIKEIYFLNEKQAVIEFEKAKFAKNCIGKGDIESDGTKFKVFTPGRINLIKDCLARTIQVIDLSDEMSKRIKSILKLCCSEIVAEECLYNIEGQECYVILSDEKDASLVLENYPKGKEFTFQKLNLEAYLKYLLKTSQTNILSKDDSIKNNNSSNETNALTSNGNNTQQNKDTDKDKCFEDGNSSDDNCESRDDSNDKNSYSDCYENTHSENSDTNNSDFEQEIVLDHCKDTKNTVTLIAFLQNDQVLEEKNYREIFTNPDKSGGSEPLDIIVKNSYATLTYKSLETSMKVLKQCFEGIFYNNNRIFVTEEDNRFICIKCISDKKVSDLDFQLCSSIPRNEAGENYGVANKYLLNKDSRLIEYEKSEYAKQFIKNGYLEKKDIVFKVYTPGFINLSHAFLNRTLQLQDLTEDDASFDKIDGILKINNNEIRLIDFLYYPKIKLGFLTFENPEHVKYLLKVKSITFSHVTYNFQELDFKTYLRCKFDQDKQELDTLRKMNKILSHGSISLPPDFKMKSVFIYFLKQSKKWMNELSNYMIEKSAKVSVEEDAKELTVCFHSNNDTNVELRNWNFRSKKSIDSFLNKNLEFQEVSIGKKSNIKFNEFKDTDDIIYKWKPSCVTIVGTKASVKRAVDLIRIRAMDTITIDLQTELFKEYLENAKTISKLKEKHERVTFNMAKELKIIVKGPENILKNVKMEILQDIVNTSEETVKFSPKIIKIWKNEIKFKEDVKSLIKSRSNIVVVFEWIDLNTIKFISNSEADLLLIAKELKTSLQTSSIDIDNHRSQLLKSNEWKTFYENLKKECRQTFYIRTENNKINIGAVKCIDFVSRRMNTFFQVNEKAKIKIQITDSDMFHLKNGLKPKLLECIKVGCFFEDSSIIANCRKSEENALETKIKAFLKDNIFSEIIEFTRKNDIFVLKFDNIKSKIIRMIGQSEKVFFKTISVPSNVKTNISILHIVEGKLSDQNTDVFLNTISEKFDLRIGVVSRSLLETAGSSLQEECQSKYPNGVAAGEVAVTGGHDLKCKYILHRTLAKNPPNNNDQPIIEYLKDCLNKVSSLSNVKSVSMPAIGTGKLGYSPELVARSIQTIANTTGVKIGLQRINVVIYPGESNILSSFQKVFKSAPNNTGNPNSINIQCSSLSLSNVKKGVTEFRSKVSEFYETSTIKSSFKLNSSEGKELEKLTEFGAHIEISDSKEIIVSGLKSGVSSLKYKIKSKLENFEERRKTQQLRKIVQFQWQFDINGKYKDFADDRNIEVETHYQRFLQQPSEDTMTIRSRKTKMKYTIHFQQNESHYQLDESNNKIKLKRIDKKSRNEYPKTWSESEKEMERMVEVDQNTTEYATVVNHLSSGRSNYTRILKVQAFLFLFRLLYKCRSFDFN
ncbi:DgyrCDS3861 [Dimorphilus gyrociliatus]|uniref:DgyrCDS3861 n=1 Tax=Dimorphilus gyrociliatus TaxID=2664684 RepID=A0A7I8VHC0_9ANNE|nr:DgyrCDS3861 [Dimorphilus gyrociliatus]